MMNSSNRRLLKNTVALYSRSFLSLIISLYTSRVVLQALGVEDYGIYNVIAGFVTMIIFVNNTLAAAASRFFSFELGKKTGDGDLHRVFRSVLTIHLLFAVVMVIVLEIAGIWFVSHKLVIPIERMHAAIWTLHFATANSVLTILLVPATALLIAHERMKVYAYMGLFQVGSKLAVALLITRIPYDTLVVFGALLLLFAFVSFLIYHGYCKKQFNEYQLKIGFDWEIQKSMFAYTGWGILGSFANIMKLQGVNMLLNIFFGPVVNAARGIAMQVNFAIYSLVSSFTQAMNPQIIKNYAAGEIGAMLLLVSRGARLSFYLLFVLSVPILTNTEKILSLWLVDVPNGTVVFTQLIIINSLIECFAQPISSAFQATGRIKWYQITVGGIMLLNLPLSFVALKMGAAPEITISISIFLSVVLAFIRILQLKKNISLLSVKRFFMDVYISSLFVAFVTIGCLFVFISYGEIQNVILRIIVSVLISIIIIYLIGLKSDEKRLALNFLKKKMRK